MNMGSKAKRHAYDCPCQHCIDKMVSAYRPNPDVGTTTTSIGPEGVVEYHHIVTPREQVLDAMIKEFLFEHEGNIKHEGTLLGHLQPAFEAIMGRKAGG